MRVLGRLSSAVVYGVSPQAPATGICMQARDSICGAGSSKGVNHLQLQVGSKPRLDSAAAPAHWSAAGRRQPSSCEPIAAARPPHMPLGLVVAMKPAGQPARAHTRARRTLTAVLVAAWGLVAIACVLRVRGRGW